MVVEVGLEEIDDVFNWFDNEVTSFVQLTVSDGTALTLKVEKGEDAFCHVFSGRLLSGGAGVVGRVVKIVVDGTVKDENPTNASGEFSFALNLPPVNNKATDYQVQVMFEGDGCSSATAYGKVNGTDYAVCTTIQYGYKPSTNSTCLTVEPQATQVATTTKTPEQMQKEAKQNGSLRIRHEFTWRYPWYRFHMIYLLYGVEQFDVGVGILGGNIIEALQDFVDRVSRYVKQIVPDLFVDYVLGEMVAAVGALSGNLVAWAIAAGISIGVKLYLLYEESWNSLEKLYTSYVAQFISLMIEVGSFIAEFLLGNLVKIAGSLMKFTSAVWAVLTLIANILLDVTFFFSIIDIRINELGGQ
jgi:hypothetical protein